MKLRIIHEADDWLAGYAQQTASAYDPDDFYNKPGSTTFVYKDRLLYSEDPKDMHKDLVSLNSQELFGTEKVHGSDYENWMLTGRVNRDGSMVAFWNTPNQLHGKLNDCIEALIDADLIFDDTRVFIQGVSQPERAGDVVSSNIEQSKVDTKEMERIQKQKQLHMMKAGDKKKAMKELGLGSSRKNRGGTPGRKWWAPQSESIE